MPALFSHLFRFWRIGATAFCFALFGLGGLFMLCLVRPFLRFFGKTAQARALRARNLTQVFFHVFCRVMVWCGTISYEVRHQERLGRTGLLIIANHPSLIDVVMLISRVHRPNCVVKASLRDNIFTRGPVLNAGFIINSEGAGLVDACVASVRAGDNLVIFPEGTRSISHDGQLSPMKRGGAHIALRGAFDITPVVISVSESMLGKGQGWHRAPQHRPHFVLTVLEDMPITPYLAIARKNTENQAARELTRDLRNLFMQALARKVPPGNEGKH